MKVNHGTRPSYNIVLFPLVEILRGSRNVNNINVGLLKPENTEKYSSVDLSYRLKVQKR